MEALSYKTRDKSTWGPGPWQDEPDKMQFTDKATGMPCLIVRNHGGALCGYVGVDGSHPYYGLDYDNEALHDLSVHGGLTFSGACAKDAKEAEDICHRVQAGEDDHVWWLGFDTSHAGDLNPAPSAGHFSRAVYRDVAYVKKEIADLAKQLKAVWRIRT